MVQFVTANPPGKYQFVGASQTTKALGPSGGKIGDYLESIVIASGGGTTLSLFDGANALSVFTVTASVPTVIPVKAYSVAGAWNITTPASLTALCVGSFT